MYSDFNMPNYYGIDNFDYRQEYNYQNFNQQNMYNSELITFNQAIDLIRQSVAGEKEEHNGSGTASSDPDHTGVHPGGIAAAEDNLQRFAK